MQQKLVSIRVYKPGFLVALSLAVIVANEIKGKLDSPGFEFLISGGDVIGRKHHTTEITNAWVTGLCFK
jgi:hypothetical protein